MNIYCSHCLNPKELCNCPKTKSDSILYIGPNLLCSAINTNDNLTLAIQKLNDAICNGTTSSTTTIFTPTTTSTTTIGILEFNDIDHTVWNNGQGDISGNTSFGELALRSNTTGDNNVAFGTSSLNSNTTGGGNTALGFNSLLQNTTANSNVAIGEQSGRNNTTGSFNCYLGPSSGSNNITGSSNTIIGYSALQNNTSGNNNIAIGNSAGSYIADFFTPNTASYGCVIIGNQAVINAVGDQNEIVIGQAAVGLGDNSVQIGNSSIAKFGFYGNMQMSTVPNTGTGTELMLVRDASTGEVKQMAISTAITVLYLDPSGDDSTAVVNDLSKPYLTMTAVFNKINSITTTNEFRVVMNGGGYVSDILIPRKNIEFINLGGYSGCSISFNPSTISNTNICNVGSRLGFYDLTLVLSNGQVFRNDGGMLYGIFSLQSSTVLTDSSALISAWVIGCSFINIKLNGNTTSGGLFNFQYVQNNKISITTLSIESGSHAVVRNMSQSTGTITFDIIDLQTGFTPNSNVVYLDYNSVSNFNLHTASGYGWIYLSKEVPNSGFMGTVNFDNCLLSLYGSGGLGTGDGHIRITGSMAPNSSGGITVTGIDTATTKFLNYIGNINTINKSAGSWIIEFRYCEITIWDTANFCKLLGNQSPGFIRFIGINFTNQGGSIFNANGFTGTAYKKGTVYAVGTVGTGVTLNNQAGTAY